MDFPNLLSCTDKYARGFSSAVSLVQHHLSWIKRGRQKRTIAHVLRKPMTAMEIREQAKALAPRIQLPEISALVKAFSERKLIYCLTPQQTMARLYFIPEEIREDIGRALGRPIDPLPAGVDWQKYAFVKAGKNRQAVLLELDHAKYQRGYPATAANIRKTLREKVPIAFRVLLRTLKDLTQQQLIGSAVAIVKRPAKVYELTDAGKRIVTELQR